MARFHSTPEGPVPFTAEEEAARDAKEAAEAALEPAKKIALIKAEAARRILDRYPDWKQANMTARAVELQEIWRSLGSWTTGEQAEQTALLAAWAWVKSVRAASDALEASPPTDPTDDTHWPA